MGTVKIQSVDMMIKDAYIKLREQGYTQKKISETLGLNIKTIQNYTKRWGLKGSRVESASIGRPKELMYFSVNDYVAMKRKNPFLKERVVAELLGVTYPTLLRWKKEHGLIKGKGAWVR